MAWREFFSPDRPRYSTYSGQTSLASAPASRGSQCKGVHAHGLKPEQFSHRTKGKQKFQTRPAKRQRPHWFLTRHPYLELVKGNRSPFLAGEAIALCPDWKGEAFVRLARTAPGRLGQGRLRCARSGRADNLCITTPVNHAGNPKTHHETRSQLPAICAPSLHHFA